MSRLMRSTIFISRRSSYHFARSGGGVGARLDQAIAPAVLTLVDDGDLPRVAVAEDQEPLVEEVHLHDGVRYGQRLRVELLRLHDLELRRRRSHVVATWRRRRVAIALALHAVEGLRDDRVRPRQGLHVVRACLHALELALVLADLALDLRDAEVDRAVHVLGRLVPSDGETVMQLEGDVDAV